MQLSTAVLFELRLEIFCYYRLQCNYSTTQNVYLDNCQHKHNNRGCGHREYRFLFDYDYQ